MEPNVNDPIEDQDNKYPASTTTISDAALLRLITIDEEFTQEHATQAVSEIKILWRDLRKTDFAAYEIYDMAQVLRQGKVLLEYRLLRAFLVAWKVLDVNFPSLDSTGQAELIRDMVLCQLGPVKEQTTPVVDNEITTPARKKTDAGVNKEAHSSILSAKTQTLSPGSPFKLLFKTQKKWARQRQLKALISQAKKPEKRKREIEDEDGCIDTVDEELSEGVQMEPTPVSIPEKKALIRQKLERKRKLEALASKSKRRRFQ
ncbi:hypothetical protein D6D19_08658 [Aureobasidium pullulans]|uniref:Uncharacterized protein n=1 Tax=Aureobasidium pullulans TaxID=5580 RepID=A0A4S8ZRW8_AURPU|nr:hypothetical protein D6D19_08658 [Aureobasidium pullulans]